MTVIEYHRPGTMDEALAWLSQKDPACVPLGGGTGINRFGRMKIGAVDLQLLGLNGIEQEGARIKVGATTTLQALLDSLLTPPALRKAVELEAAYNQRQMATVAGRLVTADGRSPLAAVLLAMDSELTWEPGEVMTGLGDWLPLREIMASGTGKKPGLVITSVKWPARMAVAFQYVARTPADKPIVCVGVAGWSSGRRRVAIGGYGQAPLLAMDGPEAGGAEEAVKDAYSQAGDEWASADYRQEMAVVLTQRCLQELDSI
jgi:CO/xanthine dehydrogenase FAD-binding subunit